MPTYYVLEEDDKVVFHNSNTACFADITSGYDKFGLNKEGIDWSKTKILFYANQTISQDVVEKFLKKVATFGVSGKLIELSKNEWLKKHPKSGVTKGDNLINIIEIDCSKYNTKRLLKFGIHVLRILIEDPGLARQYVNNKTPVGLDNFQHLRIIGTAYPGCHNYFGNLLCVSYTKPGFTQFKGNVPFHRLKEKLDKAPWITSTNSICSVYQSEFFPTKEVQKNSTQEHISTLIKLTRKTAKKPIE